VHDSSIAVNTCGDVAIQYTRSGKDDMNHAIYPRFSRWLMPDGYPLAAASYAEKER
jgi:hypothetical protein